jgi:hypothetical protein
MEWSCSTNKGGTKRPIDELRSDTMTSRVNERGFAMCDVLIRADADDHRLAGHALRKLYRAEHFYAGLK